MKFENLCPRCHEGRLKNWPELSEEEREIAKRSEPARTLDPKEYRANYRWCTRCWFATHEASADA